MGPFVLILSIRMVVPMPWIYFVWSLHSDGCIHAKDPFTWSSSWWIAMPIPWIHVFSLEILVMYMYLCLICRSPDSSVWFLARTCKAFHPSLMFRIHTLGGICYKTICHCSSTTHSLTLEDPYSDPCVLSKHGIHTPEPHFVFQIISLYNVSESSL